MQRCGQAVSAHARQLLDDDCVIEKVSACTPEFRRLIGAEQTLLPEAAPGRAIDHAPFVPIGDLGLDLALDEAADLVAEQLVLFAEDFTFHGRRSLAGARADRREFHARPTLSICVAGCGEMR